MLRLVMQDVRETDEQVAVAVRGVVKCLVSSVDGQTCITAFQLDAVCGIDSSSSLLLDDIVSLRSATVTFDDTSEAPMSSVTTQLKASPVRHASRHSKHLSIDAHLTPVVLLKKSSPWLEQSTSVIEETDYFDTSVGVDGERNVDSPTPSVDSVGDDTVIMADSGMRMHEMYCTHPILQRRQAAASRTSLRRRMHIYSCMSRRPRPWTRHAWLACSTRLPTCFVATLAVCCAVVS
jgi:hypothetical protein